MYRLCQLVSILVFLLFLPLLPLVALRGKYRHRLAGRLGFGLARLMAAAPPVPPGAPVIWLHALSVGEATSALPLVAGIRQSWKEARIVFSVTTSSGHRVAEQWPSATRGGGHNRAWRPRTAADQRSTIFGAQSGRGSRAKYSCHWASSRSRTT